MIDVKDLTFAYPGGKKEALKGISFSVKPGEIFGFLGPSGAGKSTTQKILTGQLAGYKGHISVMGKDVSSWKSDYYEKIGVSFEIPNHYLKLTAKENLDYFRSLYGGETEDSLALLRMVGLDGDANVRVSKFSKGMKVRLGFVRALLNRPDLMFLDEPTTGLDPVNARIIKDIILNKKAEGKTIFLTTHNMSLADEICDRVAFIVDGEIRLIDSPHELKIKNGRSVVRVEYSVNGSAEYREFPLAGLGANKEFIGMLNDNKVRSIHSSEATLDDIFIKVTGRSLV
ncbi:ABC transporter ATP binding protein [Methanocella paludicola SANAE]|uniref:ABC transporter ATP binding protein n=1 Tax=Methanocella paludicola (strain DSM 17711 / JCM 13418 / NBRC 101707 / SANAE) TaxID=304371 RepID=D1YZ33_METPS|nr:ABC transporter ATP binding protein [Methanocella paludicola SANAE]